MQALRKSKDGQTSHYRPGEMLSESAAAVVACEASDPGEESDCSTADTTNDIESGLQTQAVPNMMHFEGSSPFMMHNPGLLSENPWTSYAAPGYWMPYPPPVPAPWTQLPSVGSTGHFLGRCKPCAFLHKEGCRSGVDCPYCHLCPPGEKQRRKRVMRTMQQKLAPSAK